MPSLGVLCDFLCASLSCGCSPGSRTDGTFHSAASVHEQQLGVDWSQIPAIGSYTIA
jgi:hypothetical protein